MTPDWFQDTATANYLLDPGHGFGTVAEWNDGDPAVDIEGDDRPGVDGVMDMAGAHLGG